MQLDDCRIAWTKNWGISFFHVRFRSRYCRKRGPEANSLRMGISIHPTMPIMPRAEYSVLKMRPMATDVIGNNKSRLAGYVRSMCGVEHQMLVDVLGPGMYCT